MPRSLSLFAVSALALVFCLPGRGQDSPSLGDLARQAQKDKSKTSAKKVLTNDDLSSGSSTSSSGPASGLAAGPGLGQAGQPAVSAKQGATPTPADQLEKLESLLDQVASLDRATLVKNVLQGADPNFPGGAAWEDRLMGARDAYVSQGRALLQKGRDLLSSSENLKGIQDPNDPRVKNLASQLQQFIQDATRIGASFEAVMMEGRDLAGQSSPH